MTNNVSWKDRYLQTKSRYDKDKTLYNETLNEYRNAVNIFSNVISGVNPTLDKHLKSLSVQIGNLAAKGDIEKELEALSEALLYLSKENLIRSDIVINLLEHLIMPLKKHKLSDKLNQTIDTIIKRVQDNAQDVRPNELLKEYNQLFSAIVKRLAGKNGDSKKPSKKGLWAKVTGAKDTTDANENSDANVVGALTRILEHIELPPEYKDELQLLKEKIRNDVDKLELDENIEEVANYVVIAASSRGLKVNQFVVEINKRLELITSHFKENHHQDDAILSESNALSDLVKENVRNITDGLSSAKSADDVANMIGNTLSTIVSEVEHFKESTAKRVHENHSKINELEKELEETQLQSSRLQVSLIEQTQLALTDPLTNIANREAYDAKLADAYERYKRFGHNLILAVADIDYFKKINDNYGHLAGDKVLSQVANVFKDSIRAVDSVARYGGEEFVFIFEKTKMTDAKKVAEKLRLVIERSKFNFKGKKVPITVSFGLAEFTSGDLPDEVFSKADDALYSAKVAGRNLVKCAN